MAKSGKMSSSRKKPANIVKGDVSEIKEEENNFGAVEDDMAEVKDAPVKRKAEADDETLPVKKTKLINNGFCLFVGNLNASKTIEEIKSALANLFTSHGLLFQDIRVDSKKKFAYVDFQSEEDLVKALEMNEELILGQKMRLDKAKVKESAKDKKIAKDARTLFIKNIPFAATKEDLMNVFDTAVEIRFPGGIGSPSKGIAYIEFKTEAHAEKVLEEKQGTDIQGRIVVIDFLGEKSRNKKINKVPAEIPPNNKLLVTNLAYAAKEDTLKEVFLKAVSVNIPKSKGKSRGHAVIQFDSVEDATEALDSALNQEICGRVIRVEFSQDRSTKKSHQIATVVTEVKGGMDTRDAPHDPAAACSSGVSGTAPEQEPGAPRPHGVSTGPPASRASDGPVLTDVAAQLQTQLQRGTIDAIYEVAKELREMRSVLCDISCTLKELLNK
uniref:RRM domain-containing protein n=1 Tax=Esox lucius TaxID=8010 RepID=A0A3P9AM79_ESOLU